MNSAKAFPTAITERLHITLGTEHARGRYRHSSPDLGCSWGPVVATCPVTVSAAMGRIMPPYLVYEGPVSLNIDVGYMDVGPCITDPARAIPAVIDQTVSGPIKVHIQPAADYQTKTEGDK